jgi:hypothetical protein
VGELRTDYLYLWVAYDRAIAALWEYARKPSGETTRQMLAFHIYGELTTSNVRKIPVGRVNSADPATLPRWQVLQQSYDTVVLVPLASDAEPTWGGPVAWDRAPTPTDREVTEAWMQRPDVEQPRKVKLGPRDRSESVEDFYTRVADAYRTFAAQTGKPTTAIAATAGVSKQTAARWIHEARKRGLLEQTTRGRVNR